MLEIKQNMLFLLLYIFSHIDYNWNRSKNSLYDSKSISNYIANVLINLKALLSNSKPAQLAKI
jgi:hypothetical protein